MPIAFTCPKCRQAMRSATISGKPELVCLPCDVFTEDGILPTKAAKTAVRTPQQATGTESAGAVCSVTFELPLPPTGCSPNNHSHGFGPGKARAAYRAECLACLPRVCTPMFATATIRTEWFLGPAPGRYRPKDAANAISAFKAGCDAIVDAGYLVDDNASVLNWGETILRSAKESAEKSGIVVRLERKE